MGSSTSITMDKLWSHTDFIMGKNNGNITQSQLIKKAIIMY